MLHSYTYQDNTYSVIVHPEGHVTEYQRGPRRLYHGDGDRQTWASTDEWNSTWPTDAISQPPKPLPPKHPLITKLFSQVPSTLQYGISTEYVDELYEDYRNASASHEEIAIWDLLECRKLIQRYEEYLNGEDTFGPDILRPTNTYVLHDGQVLGVYHSAEDNVVLVDDNTGLKEPEELGINTEAKFLRRNEVTGTMESV